MVIRDLSVPVSRPQEHHDEIRIAFVLDRFIAAVFDFLIFSPVVSFCVAGFMKQIKTYLLLDPRSTEASVIWILFMTCALGLSALLQAVFLYFWQATPGQRFMQLKVISYPRRFEALTFSQCLLRAICWVASFGLLAAPFLEILGHPLRRAFHERASDTLVITLKEDYDEGPLPLERRFVGSWLRMFFLMIFLVAGLYGLKTYNRVGAGYFAAAPESAPGLLCSQLPAESYVGRHRQDMAIAMYLLDEVSPECLNKEADYSLWSYGDTDRAWGYLAKAIVSEDKGDQDKYFDKVCSEKDSQEACTIARYLSEDDGEGATVLKPARERSVTAQVLRMEDLLAQKNFVSAVGLIKSLDKEPLLRSALEKRYVRSIWALRDQMKNAKRQPASDKNRELIDEFKEKYGVE